MSEMKCIYCQGELGNSPDNLCSDECEMDYEDNLKLLEETKIKGDLQ